MTRPAGFESSPPGLHLGGKTVLVTGGARRIGRAICLELARAGAAVVLTYLNSQQEALDLALDLAADLAAEIASEMEPFGGRSLAVACDVRSESSVKDAVAQTIAAFGHLDILVNNAAVFESHDLATLPVEAWDRVFETNTRGPFLVAREALPHLKAAHGRIVNIGSLGGIRPWATHAHYCASKAAVHALTQSMARAFAPEVSVNCVAPGFIDFEEDRGPLAGRLAVRAPLARNGSPGDVAQAVLFFAAGPSFVTGQILAVDGGLGLV